MGGRARTVSEVFVEEVVATVGLPRLDFEVVVLAVVFFPTIAVVNGAARLAGRLLLAVAPILAIEDCGR